MKNEIEKDLKHDGKTIQGLAAKRISDGDFSQRVITEAIKAQKETPPQNSMWKFGIVAAVCLTFIFTITFHKPGPIEQPKPHELMASKPVSFDIKALPQAIDKALQGPMAKEQQAIIDDIKSFGKGLISI